MNEEQAAKMIADTGDLFVLSHGGQTGYPWQDSIRLRGEPAEPTWELDQ